MFKYKVKDEPSQEVFGAILGMTFLVFLGYMGVSGLISMIKEKFKSLDKKIEEKMNELANGEIAQDASVINGNDFPRADWTDAKDGKHWEVDEKLRKEVMQNEREYTDHNDPLICYECTDMNSYISILKKYTQFIQLLGTIKIDDSTGKQLDTKFNSLFKNEVKLGKNGVDEIQVKVVDVKWPNHPVFKNPVGVVKSLIEVEKYVTVSFRKMIVKVREVISEPTDGASKEYLASKAAYLNFVNVALDMYDMISNLFDLYQFTLNNDEVFGSCLVLKDKNGKDITDHH